VKVKQLEIRWWISQLTPVDNLLINFLFEFIFCLIFCALLSSLLSILFANLLLLNEFFFVSLRLEFFLLYLVQCLFMAVLRTTNAKLNHFKSILDFYIIVYQVFFDALKQPGKDIFVERAFKLWCDHANIGKVAQCIISQVSGKAFRYHTREQLLVGCFALWLTCFLLDPTSRNFCSNTCFCSFETLSLNKFCVSDFLVLLRLGFNYYKLFFFKHFHTCLF